MVESLLAWTTAHPHWAALVVAVVAFLESLIIISFFVPGWLLLMGLGTLVGAAICRSGQLSGPPISAL